jgi:hypothetical protein
MMNLSSSEVINQFDVRLNYTNGYSPSGPTGLVKAVSLDYSKNVFATSGYTVATQASCIDDITYGPDGFCAIDDSPTIGQVHVAQTIVGGTMSGPIAKGLLFSVTFTVNGTQTGTSLLSFDRAHITNPGGTPINPHYIQVVTSAAVFGNDPLVAFFDYSSTLSPSVLSGVNARFDASSSFRSTKTTRVSLSNPRFSWNFGDGLKTTTSNPVILHSFAVPGNYTVGLVVNDTNPGGGSFSRVVQVMPPLGSLHVSVQSDQGRSIQTIVLVRLYNYTSPLSSCRTCNRTIVLGGSVDFRWLTPGSYTLNFTGPGVDPSSKQTQVQVGWTTMETVYLTVKQPPGPNTIGLVIFGAIMGGGLGLAGLAFFIRWRRNGKLVKTAESIRKTRKPSRP